MDNKTKKEILEVIENLKKINYIKPGDLPNIDLYMDQVTTFMDQHLETGRRDSEDKLLTKTMINNYTKNKLIPSPEKKKYSRDHMYLLIFIFYLKNILSISDIQKALEPITEKFFGEKGDMTLESIYAEIYAMERDQAFAVTRDVVKKYEKSRESFENVKSDEERELLQNFALISLLSFDVFMKKQMLEELIDETAKMTEKNEKADKADKADK